MLILDSNTISYWGDPQVVPRLQTCAPPTWACRPSSNTGLGTGSARLPQEAARHGWPRWRSSAKPCSAWPSTANAPPKQPIRARTRSERRPSAPRHPDRSHRPAPPVHAGRAMCASFRDAGLAVDQLARHRIARNAPARLSAASAPVPSGAACPRQRHRRPPEQRLVRPSTGVTQQSVAANRSTHRQRLAGDQRRQLVDQRRAPLAARRLFAQAPVPRRLSSRRAPRTPCQNFSSAPTASQPPSAQR